LASPRLTIVLLVWMAAVLALSAMIPQAPSQVEDTIIRSQWLAHVPIGVRPVVERLEAFGLFRILSSWWLRAPLAAAFAHTLVMLAEWALPAWRRLQGLPDEANSLGRSFKLRRTWPETAEPVCRGITDRLAAAGYTVQPGSDGMDFVAWRRRWSWLAPVGLYLGLGLAALGLILSNWVGQVQEVSLEPGDLVTLSAPGAPSLVLDGVTVAGDNPSKPGAGLARLHLVSGVGESQPVVAQLHGSHFLRGAWLTLAELSPVVEVTALDAESEREVLLQAFSPRTPPRERVRLALSSDPEARFVGVPERNLTLHVNYQDARGQTPPTVSLSFFRGADASSSQLATLADGDEITFEGVRYAVTFDYNAVLRLNGGLWWLAVAAGGLIATFSLLVLAIVPPVYLQGKLEEAGEGCSLTLKSDIWGDDLRRQRELRVAVATDPTMSRSPVE
jgi:hypothetical protein